MCITRKTVNAALCIGIYELLLTMGIVKVFGLGTDVEYAKSVRKDHDSFRGIHEEKFQDRDCMNCLLPKVMCQSSPQISIIKKSDNDFRYYFLYQIRIISDKNVNR